MNTHYRHAFDSADAGTELKLSDLQITGNKEGVNVGEGAKARIEGATLKSNGVAGITIQGDAKPSQTSLSLTETKIHEHDFGIIAKNATLRIDGCDLSRNKSAAYGFDTGARYEGAGNVPPLPRAKR